MAKHNIEAYKRKLRIEEITRTLKHLLPDVLLHTDFRSEASLHSTYGGKNHLYIDIKNEVIHTPDQFISLWLQGYMRYMENMGAHYKNTIYYKNYLLLKEHEILRTYVLLFLERTFLREFKALSKKRPTVEGATIWLGQQRASYGLLVTPRFKNGNWENDKSEIRHFNKDYWTIGHILQSGLTIPFVNEIIKFRDVEQYLVFFKNTLVRASSSPHEMEIAIRYCDFVRNHDSPETVPLLIPEFRYGGIQPNHQYRLDFCIN